MVRWQAAYQPEDAKFTYDLIMDPKNKIITRTGWEDIDTFETPDDLTVRMTFKKDKPYALETLPRLARRPRSGPSTSTKARISIRLQTTTW